MMKSHKRLTGYLNSKKLETDSYPTTLVQNQSFRCYAPFEMEKIDAEGRGFIMFLEQTGIS